MGTIRSSMFTALLIMVMQFFFVSSCFAQKHISSEKLLPKKVYAYVSIPSVSDFKKSWSQTQISKILNSQELAPFIADVSEKFNLFVSGMESDVKFKFKDLTAEIDGELAFAVFSPPRSPIAVATIADFKDADEAAVIELLARIEKQFVVAESLTLVVEEYQGVKIHSLIDKNRNDYFSYFVHSGLAVSASHKAAVKSIVDRLDGKNTRTLAENTSYIETRKNLEQGATENFSQPVVKYFLDPMNFLKALTVNKESSEEFKKNTSIALMGLNAYFASQLKAIGGQYDFVKDGIDFSDRFTVLVDQPAQGVFKAFKGGVNSQWPGKSIPASASGYASLNLDFSNTFDVMLKWSQATGTVPLLENFLDEQHGGAEIDDVKKLLAEFKGELSYFVVMTEGDKRNEAACYAVKCQDPKSAMNAYRLLDQNFINSRPRMMKHKNFFIFQYSPRRNRF